MIDDLVKRLRDKVEDSKIYDDDITLASIVRVINREELLDADCKIEGSKMSNDLVKRLQWWAFKFCGKGEQENLASDAMSDAIRRIEKLEGELHLCFHRIEELQAALREIVDCITLPAQNDCEMREIARKALEDIQ